MYDMTENQKYLAKNINSGSAEVICVEALLKLGIYISATKYWEEEVFCFNKVTEDDKKMNEEAETVSNLEEKIKIKQAFYTEKKSSEFYYL